MADVWVGWWWKKLATERTFSSRFFDKLLNVFFFADRFVCLFLQKWFRLIFCRAIDFKEREVFVGLMLCKI